MRRRELLFVLKAEIPTNHNDEKVLQCNKIGWRGLEKTFRKRFEGGIEGMPHLCTPQRLWPSNLALKDRLKSKIP